MSSLKFIELIDVGRITINAVRRMVGSNNHFSFSVLRNPLFAATPPQCNAQGLQRGIRFYRG